MSNQHLYPLKAIRANCKECSGAGSGFKAVDECQIGDCTLHPFRFAKRPLTVAIQAGKSIDEYCLHCMGARGKISRKHAGNKVRECNITKCELHHIRFGERKRGHWERKSP